VTPTTSTTTDQLDPQLTALPGLERVAVAWRESANGESLNGLSLQVLDFAGNPQLGATGATQREVSDETWIGAVGIEPDGGEVVLFAINTTGTPPLNELLAARVAVDGTPTWSPISLAAPGPTGNGFISGHPDCGYWVTWETTTNFLGDVDASFWRNEAP